MNLWDKRLIRILDRYDLTNYIIPPYKPYCLKKIEIYKGLNDLIEQTKDKKIGVFCQRSCINRVKKIYPNSMFFDCPSSQAISGTIDFEKEYHECMQNFGEIDAILILYPHMMASMVLEKLYSIQVKERIINACDYLESKGIYPSIVDLILPGKDTRERAKRIIWQIITWYGLYISCIRRMLYRKGRKLPDVPGYFDIYNARQELLYNRQGLNYEYVEKKYIALLCEMKDFSSVFDYINDNPNCSWLNRLGNDLKGMLDDIQKHINNRKSPAIVWNWVDNVTYKDFLNDMPFLCKQALDSVFFPNTYTMMPWTSWTFKTIFSGKNVIRDKIFLYEPIGEARDGSYPFYDEFINRGYDIYYLGADYHRQKMRKPDIDKYGDDSIHDFLYHSTAKQWRALTMLAEDESKLFLIIHDLYESHTPYLTPFAIRTDEFEEEKRIGRQYMDTQLKWYSRFMDNCDNITSIYMSDHGDAFRRGEEYDIAHYDELRVHTFFMVRNNQVKGQCSDGFLSVKNCAKLLLNILDGKSYDGLLDEYVHLECYDTYSKPAVEATIPKVRSIDKSGWMQFMGYLSKKEKYILFADGEERYYLLPDEVNNKACDDSYKDRVQELNKEMAPYIIDPFQYDFFVNSTRLYKACDTEALRKETNY